MQVFTNIFVIVTLPAFAFIALLIWRPAHSPKPEKPVLDRLAWTFFAFGIGLMFNMALYASACEDGAYRPWETIRLHTHVFLTLALISVVGPLIVFVFQTRGPNHFETPCEKSQGDELD